MSIRVLNSTKKRRGLPKGGVAVEFAIVAPVFLLIMGGIIEFGQAFKTEHLLSNACRRGARAAILSGSTTSLVQTNVKNQCVSMMGVKSSDVMVSVLVNGQNSDVSAAIKGDQIDVKVTIPFEKVGTGFFTYLFKDAKLSSTCILEHE